MLRHLLLSLILLTTLSSQKPQLRHNLTLLDNTEPEATIEYFTVPIDHFGQDPSATFKMKVLSLDTYFKPNGPILVYLGNEGEIEAFYNNTGFIRETLAQRFNGIAIYVEHRYYGQSLPFGKTDTDIKKNKYLSVEQALMDFVTYIIDKKTDPTFKNSKVIAFGGSYGGMLAAWGRMKFPQVFDGALASSAPILLFKDLAIGRKFFSIVTDTYRRTNEKCPVRIREAYKSYQEIKQFIFNKDLIYDLTLLIIPCKPITKPEDLLSLEATFDDSLVYFAQYNLPYKVDKDSILPANPVKTYCDKILQKEEPPQDFVPLTLTPKQVIDVLVLVNALRITQKRAPGECLDIGNDGGEQFIWSFQACTQMIFPIGKNGIDDMFNPQEYNEEEFKRECQKTWGGKFDPDWPFKFYGGSNYAHELKQYSNLMFTNGTMDPWNAGCPQESENPDVKILTADAPHHMDLQLPRKEDYPSVTTMRQGIIEELTKWLGN